MTEFIKKTDTINCDNTTKLLFYIHSIKMVYHRLGVSVYAAPFEQTAVMTFSLLACYEDKLTAFIWRCSPPGVLLCSGENMSVLNKSIQSTPNLVNQSKPQTQQPSDITHRVSLA